MSPELEASFLFKSDSGCRQMLNAIRLKTDGNGFIQAAKESIEVKERSKQGNRDVGQVGDAPSQTADRHRLGGAGYA